MYGLCVLFGIIASGFLLHAATKKRRDFSYIQIVNIPLFSIAGAFLGAKLLYALTRIDVLINAFESLPSFGKFFGLLGEAFGGMVFYGGLIGAILTAYGYCRLAKLDFWLYADIFAPAIPLFHAFGRIGCLMSGCCYGIVSDWGIMYHSDFLDPSVNDVTRIPIQPIESCLNLLIMLILLLLDRKRLKKGSLLAVYFILYAVVRFSDEFFRGDDIRGYWLFLTTSQWISIVLLTVGIIMLLRRYVFTKTKELYGVRVETGTVPEGYIYNQYAGAVAPEEQ